jgi:hypothetical protein
MPKGPSAHFVTCSHFEVLLCADVDAIAFSGTPFTWSCSVYCATPGFCDLVISAQALNFFLRLPPLIGKLPETIGQLSCRSKISKMYSCTEFLILAYSCVVTCTAQCHHACACYCSDLAGNRFTGTLPASIGALTALKHMYVPLRFPREAWRLGPSDALIYYTRS